MSVEMVLFIDFIFPTHLVDKTRRHVNNGLSLFPAPFLGVFSGSGAVAVWGVWYHGGELLFGRVRWGVWHCLMGM